MEVKVKMSSCRHLCQRLNNIVDETLSKMSLMALTSKILFLRFLFSLTLVSHGKIQNRNFFLFSLTYSLSFIRATTFVDENFC